MAEMQTKITTKTHDAEQASEKRRLRKPVSEKEKLKETTGESIYFEGLLGDSAVDLPIERRASLLSDPRFSHAANATQKARIIAGLQHTYGNIYVQRLLDSRAVQAKLIVNPPHDKYEKEADRVADVVAKASEFQVQAQAAEEEEGLQGKAVDSHLLEGIQHPKVPTVESISLIQKQQPTAAKGEAKGTKSQLSKLLKEVQKSPTIKKTISQITKKTGDTTLRIKWSSKGSYQQGKLIYIDKNESLADQVNSLSHEIMHLRDYVFGKQPGVTSLSKEAFVKKKMDNEINAHYKSYVAYEERGSKGAKPLGYDGFKAQVDNKESSKKMRLGPEAREKIGKKYLENQYKNVWVGSKTGLNYYQKWERHWEQKNPGK